MLLEDITPSKTPAKMINFILFYLFLSSEVSGRNNVSLPKFIERKFQEEFSKFPANVTHLYRSIPLEATHIKDDIFLMTAPYRKSKCKILNVRLWIEFPNITRSRELQSDKYLIDVTPVIGSRYMEGSSDCSAVTIVSRPRFPEDILELKFDVTTVYKSCRGKDDSTHFKFKFRFYSFSDPSDIDLNSEDYKSFIVFKEYDEIDDDLLQLMAREESIPPLHYEHVMKKVPPVRSLRIRRKGVKTCSLRPFTFNFLDAGWKDFIIAPLEYQPNQCKGRCGFPLAGHLNATNYAVLKALATTIYGKVGAPTCIAQGLAPQSMIVMEDNQIIMKVYKEMIATSCKCA